MSELALAVDQQPSFDFSPTPGLASPPAVQAGVGGYIYKITCSENKKPYVGSTIQSPIVRYKQHIGGLKNKNHHSSKLQNSYNKHGEESLSCEVVEVVKLGGPTLLEREQHWIDFLDSYKNGLNGSPKADRPMLGVVKTPEQIEKWKKSRSAWDKTEDGIAFRLRCGIAAVKRFTGIKRPKHVCDAVSQKAKLRWSDPAIKKKQAALMRAANNGWLGAKSKHENFIKSKFPTLGVSGFVSILRWCCKNNWSVKTMHDRFSISKEVLYCWIEKYCSDINWVTPRKHGYKCPKKIIASGKCYCCGDLVVIRGSRWRGVFICRKCYIKERGKRKHLSNNTGLHTVHVEKKCPHCGGVFKNNRRKFCKPKCNRDFHNGMRYKKPAPIAESGLEPITPNQLT